VFAFLFIVQQPWFHVPSLFRKNERDFDSYQITAVFLTSTFQYIIIAVVYSKSHPYRKTIFNNHWFFAVIAFCVVLCLWITLSPLAFMIKLLELKMPPFIKYRLVIVMLAGIHWLLAYAAEAYIIDGLLVWLLERPRFNRRTSRFMRIVERVAKSPSWCSASSSDDSAKYSSSKLSDSVHSFYMRVVNRCLSRRHGSLWVKKYRRPVVLSFGASEQKAIEIILDGDWPFAKCSLLHGYAKSAIINSVRRSNQMALPERKEPINFLEPRALAKDVITEMDEPSPNAAACVSHEQCLQDEFRFVVRRCLQANNTVDQWTPFRRASITQLPLVYSQLSKARLSSLVVMTAALGYFMCPLMQPCYVASLVSCCVGTALMSFGANALNQLIEFPFDSQMQRTCNRVLVRNRISWEHALGFAVLSSISGFVILYNTTSSMTAMLGLLNIALYAFVYTPLKRITYYNTFIGSFVGAIPPLMGWTAAAGGTLCLPALVLGGILYSWQFPHFSALSWKIRRDYSKAGFRMMCILHPKLCKQTALSFSVMLTVLCSIAAPVTELTSWTFTAVSFPLNAYLCASSYR
ncbi:unnamed protein product, partial [Soboliphyme baturini]|uniref:Protoheme IX farnesyltransferase, mitochondrial n=1 Tax=Soboliphyme baturini TaxID=241478 RepID=A0A183IXP1_9BILA